MTEYLKKVIMLLVGLIVLSAAVVVIIKADLGLDPITTMSEGISNTFNITIGSGSQLLMGMMLIVVLLMDRKRIGLGTVLHGVLVGFLINAINKLPIVVPDFFGVEIILLLVGNIMFGVGLALYIFAGLGEGTVDGFMMIIHNKLKIKLGLVKVLLDVVLVIGGYLLGAHPGVGTIVCAIMIGPIVEVTLKLFNKLGNRNMLDSQKYTDESKSLVG